MMRRKDDGLFNGFQMDMGTDTRQLKAKKPAKPPKLPTAPNLQARELAELKAAVLDREATSTSVYSGVFLPQGSQELSEGSDAEDDSLELDMQDQTKKSEQESSMQASTSTANQESASDPEEDEEDEDGKLLRKLSLGGDESEEEPNARDSDEGESSEDDLSKPAVVRQMSQPQPIPPSPNNGQRKKPESDSVAAQAAPQLRLFTQPQSQLPLHTGNQLKNR